MHPSKLYPDDALRAAIAKHCWGAGYRPGHPLMSDQPTPPDWVAERAHARRWAAKPTHVRTAKRSVLWVASLRMLSGVALAACAAGCAL